MKRMRCDDDNNNSFHDFVFGHIEQDENQYRDTLRVIHFNLAGDEMKMCQ